MASVTDLVKFAVSNAVSAANAAKTAGSTKVTTGGSTKKTASSGSSGGTTSGVKSQRDKDIETISKPGGTIYYGDGRAAVTNTGKAWQSGVDYSAEAAKYAAMGDWGAVDDVLMRRDAKMKDTGSTGGGKSNLELWKELNDRYGGPSAGKSLEDMQAGAEQAYGAGGKYAGSGTQTPSALEPGYGDYMSFEDFLAGTGYDQYTDATQAAIKAAVQNAVNGYRDQIDTTNRDSDELARQAYIAKMMGQKNLDQQMAANGYAGGMADSQRIATETDYQNQLSEIEKQRLATVKELESAITNAQLTGDMQTAQELADYLQTIQGQWVNYVQNQQQMAQQNYWNQQNLDAQNTESARSWAMQQMARGIMPEDETLTAAGISKQAAQQQVALVLAGGTQGTKKTTSRSTTSSTTTSKPRLTLAQTQEALKNGIVNESTLNAYEYYYGEPYKVDATNSDNKVPVSPPNYSTVVKNSSSGYYGKAFNVVLNNVQAQRNRGANLETLAGTIEEALNKGDITKAGAQSLMQALGIGQ